MLGYICLHCMLKSPLWFPRVQWQTFQIQQLCIHTQSQCSVILVCHWWYKLFVHWWMKGIHFASFYFRVWDLTREIRENKNPAKISTYTVTKFQNSGIRRLLKLDRGTKGVTAYWQRGPKQLSKVKGLHKPCIMGGGGNKGSV